MELSNNENYSKENLNELSNIYDNSLNKDKPYFGSILNSHDHYNTRTPIFDELSKYVSTNGKYHFKAKFLTSGEEIIWKQSR